MEIHPRLSHRYLYFGHPQNGISLLCHGEKWFHYYAILSNCVIPLALDRLFEIFHSFYQFDQRTPETAPRPLPLAKPAACPHLRCRMPSSPVHGCAALEFALRQSWTHRLQRLAPLGMDAPPPELAWLHLEMVASPPPKPAPPGNGRGVAVGPVAPGASLA